MNYAEISKETIGLLYQSRLSLRKSPLDLATQTLVELRVSQINKCSYCCQLHLKEAQKLGVKQEKLDALSDWSSSSFFTENEKIVLQWVESVTYLDENFEETKEKLKKRHIPKGK